MDWSAIETCIIHIKIVLAFNMLLFNEFILFSIFGHPVLKSLFRKQNAEDMSFSVLHLPLFCKWRLSTEKKKKLNVNIANLN